MPARLVLNANVQRRFSEQIRLAPAASREIVKSQQLVNLMGDLFPQLAHRLVVSPHELSRVFALAPAGFQIS